MDLDDQNVKQTLSINWGKVDWGLTTAELVQEIDASYSYITTKRRIHAPNTVNKKKIKLDWRAVDWSKSDKQLSVELGISKSTIYAKRSVFAVQTLKKRKIH